MMFRSISENKFIGTSDGNIISWCPTMDLLTITMNRMSLWVFRINGERVYSVNNRSPITEISWKPDGRSFALMGIDGICKIYDSNSGKLINTIEPGPGRLKLNITQTIQWSDTKTRTARNSSSRSTSKFSGIFDIDISTQLPVLPTPHAYTSKVMVDDMNQQGSDLLMIVDSCKSLSLTFHNIFTTDSIDMPKEGIKKYLKLASYSLDKLFFLVKTDVPLSMSTEVSLIEMNLNLVRSFQMEIILQCSKILAILEYMEETFEAIKPDLSSFLDNLDRHLSNFKDCLYEDVDLTTCFPTLQEAEDKMSVALYDILVTNLIPEEQRDYWLNQFGERGLKKLQSLGQAAYALIRKIGFSQIISALERLIVILGRLEGISKWLDSENSKADSNNFGLSTEGISRSIEFASVLLKRTYEFIWEINEELKLFNFFMEWLKNVIIERLAKEDDILSVTSEVGNEKYLTLSGYKNSDLMKFVDGHLFSTRILKYINLEKDYEVVRSSSKRHVIFQPFLNRFPLH